MRVSGSETTLSQCIHFLRASLRQVAPRSLVPRPIDRCSGLHDDKEHALEDMITSLQTAGYRVEGDAAVIALGPAVEVRANGLAHLLESCAVQKIDPVQVLA